MCRCWAEKEILKDQGGVTAVIPGAPGRGLETGSSAQADNQTPGETQMSKINTIALVPTVLALTLVVQTAAALMLVG